MLREVYLLEWVVNSHSRLVSFWEKPPIPSVCIGVYLFSRTTLRTIEAIEKDRFYTSLSTIGLSAIDLGKGLIPKLIEDKRTYGPILGHQSSATYIDTGSYTGMQEAESRLEALYSKVLRLHSSKVVPIVL